MVVVALGRPECGLRLCMWSYSSKLKAGEGSCTILLFEGGKEQNWRSSFSYIYCLEYGLLLKDNCTPLSKLTI